MPCQLVHHNLLYIKFLMQQMDSYVKVWFDPVFIKHFTGILLKYLALLFLRILM